MLAAAWSEPVPATIELPAELHRRFRKGAPRFNDTAAIAELYTEDEHCSAGASRDLSKKHCRSRFRGGEKPGPSGSGVKFRAKASTVKFRETEAAVTRRA
jgi:hypothetical protein